MKPLEYIQLDINIDSNNIEQKFSLNPVLSKIGEINDDAPLGTKILTNELCKLIKTSEPNADLLHNDSSLKSIFEIIANLSGDLKLTKDELIAFANPVPDKIIYSNNAIQKLFDSDLKLCSNDCNSDNFSIKNKLLYYLILERFYEIDNIETEFIYESKYDGFSKYYALEVDFSFVKIHYEGKLPKLNLATIKEYKYDSNDLLNKTLLAIDLSKFKFEGFSILRFKNKDKELIINKLNDFIKNLNLKDKSASAIEINNIFKSIIHKHDLSFFFLPIFELSGFPISDNEYAQQSILLGQYLNESKACNSCNVYAYLSKPIIWSYGLDDDLNIDDAVFINILREKEITNYLGIPLFHSNQFVGFIEIYASKNNFDKNDALKLKPYLPHFSQLANDFVHYLKNNLNKIILDNYTSIQPALQWKFNEVAVSYFSQLTNNEETAQLEKVIFKDVYPIYGAVDIKDSTRIRNNSQKQVILQHINDIENLLLKTVKHLEVKNRTIFKESIDRLQRCIRDKGIEKNIVPIRDFFENEIPQFLSKIEELKPTSADIISSIHHIRKQSTQIIETENDPFEKSLNILTKMIQKEYEVMNKEFQQIFPCYFETFRTDGIEFDAYIGQSITPTSTFKYNMLQDIRKIQLMSMIRIIQNGRIILEKLPIPLRTTQLLFVHPEKISISFRADEKRFDVEGGYNIRYQIIKKRIDKALIENTKERLVQPETIAIVYNSESVENDIKANLEEMKKMDLLEPNFEFLSLEELQGVSELKAIRVRVK